MNIYNIDKFLIRHFVFFYFEIKRAIIDKQPTRGSFKILKRLYVRLVVNYIETINYYLFNYSKYKNKNLNLDKNYNLEIHGIEFLKNQNINLIDFIIYNHNKNSNTIITTNKINYKKAELFAKSNNFHKIAKKYLKVNNCNLFVDSWNTYTFDKDEQLQTGLWHRDRDGIKLVKIFIYLTDMKTGCGAHFYILGSHKKKPFRFVPQFRYKDKAIKNYFKIENIIEIFGEAGTCFVEDTTGFHRGSKPKDDSNRSILCFTYFTGPLHQESNCEYIEL